MSQDQTAFALRSANREDIPEILRLVRELATYEREPHAVEATEDLYARWLFPADGAPTAYAEVAEVEGVMVGIALWYPTFSTWTGRPGIWLEDLFVEPGHRGAGIGLALLRRLAAICVQRGTDASDGACCGGTSRRSASTRRSGRWRWRSGSTTGSTVLPSRGWPGVPKVRACPPRQRCSSPATATPRS